MPTVNTTLDQPRISSNQLGEFVFSSPTRKYRILQDQKFGNKFTSPYYKPALDAILQSFDGRDFNLLELIVSRSAIEARPAKHRNQAARWSNNATMLRCFADLASRARPPAGNNQVVRQNALIDLSGVTISVRPEIITRQPNGLFSYTKLRFSKSKVSEDASEIVLLLLLKFGQRRSQDGTQIDPSNTKLVDCFARAVIEGHTLQRIREQQLDAALSEIAGLWPTVRPSATQIKSMQLSR